ncbi:MAG: gliding motility-associated C-terminal domain-containing protein [Ferruginibacter sp.]
MNLSFFKRLIIIILCAATMDLNAQNLLYQQGFEGDPCENWGFAGGVVSQGTQHSGSHSGRIGFQSNSLVFSAADVSGYAGLILKIYHSVNTGQGPGMDTREGAIIQVSIDNKPYVTIGSVSGYDDANWGFNTATGGAVTASPGCTIYSMPNPLVLTVPDGTTSVRVKVLSVKAGSCNAFNTAMSNATPNLYDRSDEGFYIDDIQITTTTPLSPVILTSAPGTDAQYLNACLPVAISSIIYNAGPGVVDVTGLPPGVMYTYTAGIVTITGTPLSDGVYHYTVKNICTNLSAAGTITKASPSVSTQTKDTSSCNSILFNNKIYTSSVSLKDTLRDHQGCDSVCNITNITIKTVTPVVQTSNLESCDKIIFNGTTYTTSAIVRDTLKSYLGCDSVYSITNITIKTVTPVIQTSNLESCDKIIFDGTTYTTSAIVRDTLKSYLGCDSVYNTTNVTIKPVTPVVQTSTLESCDKVIFNGITYTTSAIIRDTLKSYLGCDSVYNITNVTIKPVTPVIQTSNLESCDKVIFNGTTYTTSAIIRDTLKSYLGCDSVYSITNITIKTVTPVIQTSNLESCDKIIFNGITYTTSAIVRDTLKSYLGCDSVYNITNVTIKPVTPVIQTSNLESCDKVIFNGITYTTSAIIRDTLKSYLGCDSVYSITNITIKTVTPVIQTSNLESCDKIIFNGTTYTTSAIVRDTLKSYLGCDSVYNITNITIKPVTPVVQTSNLESCDKVIFNGTTYTTSAIVRDTLKSYLGCDSVYKVTNITINPVMPVIQTSNIESCNKVLFNGTTYTASVIIKDTLTSYYGCDSIYKITSITIRTLVPVQQTRVLYSCSTITFNGITYENSVALKDTVRSYQGCDSLYRITNIYINPVTPGTKDTMLKGCSSLEYNGKNYISSANFTDTIKSAGGCDSIYRKVSLIIIPNNFVLQLTGPPGNIEPQMPVTLHTTAATNYSVIAWYPSTTFSLQTATIQNIIADTTMHITVTAKSTDGCTSSASLLLTVNQPGDDIYFPSAFNPLSNYGNNGFGPVGNRSLLKNYSLQVYNRWGELVFSSNDPFQKWNGLYKGRPVNLGNFVWQASYLLRGSLRRIKKGNITLIR